MIRQLNRIFRDVEDEDIENFLDANSAVIPQIEGFATKHGIELYKGSKVDLARSVKQQMLKATPTAIPNEYIDKWEKIF